MKKVMIYIFLAMLISNANAQINPNGGFENGLSNWYIAKGSCQMEVVESFVYNDSTILPFEGKKLLRVYQNDGVFGDCIISTKVPVNKVFINEYEFIYASIFLSSDSNLQFKDRANYFASNKAYPIEYNGYKNPSIQYKFGGHSKSLDLRYQYPNLLVDSIELQFLIRNIDTIGFDLLLDKVEYFIKTASVVTNKIADFNIYPNPSNGNYTIDGYEVNSAKILDLNGRLITALENIERNKLDLSSLKNGMYLLLLRDENKNEVYKKIVKQ